MRFPRLAFATGLVVLLSSSAGRAVLLDPAFTETYYVYDATNLISLTGLAWAPDGTNRLFVTRKDGVIFLIKNGVQQATPFATVTPVFTDSECGLTGIAVDPNFLVNHYLYVFVTVSATEQQIIRYTVDGDVGTDKTIIVAGLPTQGINHDGGGLGFGPDGKMYWSIGDQGLGMGVNDDLAILAAKVGRANIDGTPAADNPFVDGAGPNSDYIWARGFRNPFTLTFQPDTGLLWVNDVGNLYEQVFVVHKGDHAGWNTYENTQPAGFISPVIVYRTNGVDTRTILPTGAARAGGRVTFATDAAHGFRVGGKVTVSGVTDTTFNGAFFVSGIPSATSFQVVQAGADAVSGGGSAATAPFGGCVTGGAFYDATGFPAAYHGNFFFGDYVSNFVMRATIDPITNGVTSVDQWAFNIGGAVDATVGPDGALYYAGFYTYGVLRSEYNATGQRLIVSPTNVWIAEGQPALVMVRLAVAPATDIAVSVARSTGDADIAVGAGATLTFSPTSWNTPQPVTVTAGRDLDSSDDSATFEVRAANLDTQSFVVHVRDDNAVALVAAPSTVMIEEGGTGTFTVALSAQPSLDVNVTATRSAGDADVTVTGGSTLTFTRGNWSVPQTVTVAAAVDADGTNDAATIAVSAQGIGAQMVSVSAHDGTSAPAITSSAVMAGVVGMAYSYDVEATGTPAPAFALDSNVVGMQIDPATGVITWTPAAAGSFSVTVRARNGTPPDALQTFSIDVAPAPAGPDAAVGTPDASQGGGPDAPQLDAAVDGGTDAPQTDAQEGPDAQASRDVAADSSPARDAPAGDGTTGVLSGGSGCGCRVAGENEGGAAASAVANALVLALAGLVLRWRTRLRLRRQNRETIA